MTRRITVACLGLIGVTIVAVGSLQLSDFPMGTTDVLRTLLGGGTRLENVVVFDIGLPRTLVAIAVGVAFGLSGALTQTVGRNALATPDILGITAGAGAAAVLAIALGSGWAQPLRDIGIPLAAIVGAAAAAVALYLLSWRDGLDPVRLVLVGVALTWLFGAVVGYTLTRAQIADVARAQRWLVGSVSDATWAGVVSVTVAVAVATAMLVWIRRDLTMLDLGDDLASALGVPVGRTSGISVTVAVALCAVAVAAAGPIAFVALLSPQIAVRLAGTPAPPLALSSVVGALLVLGSDLLTRSVLPGGLAVGVVTAGLGGPLLLHLLIRSTRKASL
ncbi:iron chelate uptake ABC transporter family permease subunit [Williamsia sp. CHRR-6]|uniref:FecCD family ABC transporter permease n=1 Tax=Williamsia sp. CHRR-6 TaxID=2835871 RepID=UPI001BDB03FB|nr:iron chelate uptake ABC transporter family permease subunit [Williamsia sp. CHRR-6]MBT0566174.1 iron chelate uptake ABC transporter family permease subunit [Williamsia sp. CHRR-6]